jgi:hypothetical protein
MRVSVFIAAQMMEPGFTESPLGRSANAGI